jgi:hypothetical protein
MRAKSEKAEGEPGQGGPLASTTSQARFDTLSAVHDPGYIDLIRRLDESDHVPRPAARRRPAVNPLKPADIPRPRSRFAVARGTGSGTNSAHSRPGPGAGDRFESWPRVEVSRYTHLT